MNADAQQAHISAAEDALVLDVLIPSVFEAKRVAGVHDVDVDAMLLVEAHQLALERHQEAREAQQQEGAPSQTLTALRVEDAQKYEAEISRVRAAQDHARPHLSGMLPPHPFKFHRAYSHHRHLAQCDVAVASLFAASYTPPYQRQTVAQYGLPAAAFQPHVDPRSPMQLGFQIALTNHATEAAKHKLRVRDSVLFRHTVDHRGAPGRAHAANVGHHGEEPTILRVALPKHGTVAAEVARSQQPEGPLNLQSMQHCSHWHVTALALHRAEAVLRGALGAGARDALDVPFEDAPYETMEDVLGMHAGTPERGAEEVKKALRSQAFSAHSTGGGDPEFRGALPPTITSRLLWFLYNGAILYQADVLKVNGRAPVSDAEVWACLLQGTGTAAVLPRLASREALVMLGASDLAQPLPVAPGRNAGMATPPGLHAHGFPAHMAQHTPHGHQQLAAAAEAAPRVPYGFPTQYRPVSRCAQRAAVCAAHQGSCSQQAWEAERQRLLQEGTKDAHGVHTTYEVDPDLPDDLTAYANARASAARSVAARSTSSVAAEVAKWVGYGDDAHNVRGVVQAHLGLMLKDPEESNAVLTQGVYHALMQGMFQDTAPSQLRNHTPDTSVLGEPLSNLVHTWRPHSSGEFLRSDGVHKVVAQWEGTTTAGGRGVCQSSGLVARIRMHLLGVVGAFAPVPVGSMTDTDKQFVRARAEAMAVNIQHGAPSSLLGVSQKRPVTVDEAEHLLVGEAFLRACVTPDVQLMEAAKRVWLAFALRFRARQAAPVWDKSYTWVHDGGAAHGGDSTEEPQDVTQEVQQYANAHAVVPLTAMVPLLPGLCSSEEAPVGDFSLAQLRGSLPAAPGAAAGAVAAGFPAGATLDAVDRFVFQQFTPVEGQLTDMAALSEGTGLPLTPGAERMSAWNALQERTRYVGGANASPWGMLGDLRSQALRRRQGTGEDAVLGALLLMFAYRVHTNAHGSTVGASGTVEAWAFVCNAVAAWMRPLTGEHLHTIVANVRRAAGQAASAADSSARGMAAAAAPSARLAAQGGGPSAAPTPSRGAKRSRDADADADADEGAGGAEGGHGRAKFRG